MFNQQNNTSPIRDTKTLLAQTNSYTDILLHDSSSPSKMTSWQNLTNSQKNYYLEFYAPTENNVCQTPRDDELVYHYTPCEAQINAVCDTGDRLCRTINYRLTANKRLAISAWVREHKPNHPDPLIPQIALI